MSTSTFQSEQGSLGRVCSPFRLSLGLFVVGLLIFAILRVASDQNALKFVVPFYVFLMVFIVLVFTLPQRALRYRLEPQKLEIQYWFGRFEINLQNATLEVIQIKTRWRLFGISTGFYNAGLFSVNGQQMRVYGSLLNGDAVVIRLAGKNTIITPADPQGFLQRVQESRV